MRMIKRTLAILMVLALLACVPVAVTAEEASAAQEIFAAAVKHSITVEEATGNGLAFMFKVNVRGAAVNARNEFVNTDAVATVGGVDYQVVAMGAVMTNQVAHIPNIDSLTREDINDERTIIDVPAKYLCEEPEADSCAFAVRIIRLPDSVHGFAIACRPYVVLKDAQNNEMTLYGTGDISAYNEVYYANAVEETPVLDLSIGDVDERLSASATAEYAAICPTYREGFKVKLTLENVSANAKTSAGDYVEYACKDAEGNLLCTEKVAVDALNPGESKTVEFYAPIDTASIEKGAVNLNYVPTVTLPAIGTDIDVTKKKNRIRVSAASAAFNEDGTIAVSLTFRNYTTNWITEETDYVKYTYYDATGKAIKTVTLYIGCIDTKKHPSKTFAFDVPANTAEVKITSSKITYWTEWA